MVKKIVCLEPDVRRRAAVAQIAYGAKLGVEPCAAVDEIFDVELQNSVILVADVESCVEDLARSLVEESEWYPVVAYGESSSADRIVDALSYGISGYLNWPFSAEDLIKRLPIILKRFEKSVIAKRESIEIKGRIEKLSRREYQVLNLMAEGHSNKLIAEKLNISPRTVEIHRSNMLNKMYADNSLKAVVDLCKYRLAYDANV